MARYFFHTEDGSRFTDEDGLELDSHHKARLEAISTLSEMLRSEGDGFWESGNFRLTVTDEDGLIYFVIHVTGVEAPAVRRERDTLREAAAAEASNVVPLLPRDGGSGA